jgi:hypothetical protein
MPLKPFEDFDLGGVDSRSNPLNLPKNRFLRCLNWVPKEAGYFEQRWGYSTVSVSTTSASQIHTLIPYTLYNGTKYLIRFQGTTPFQIALAGGAVTNPTVRGAAFASSAGGSFYSFSNRIHYGNGTDQKWFDGTTWRDNGLRSLTAAEVANIVLGFGVIELSTDQNSTISLTAAGGGSFTASTGTGMLFYVSLFDATTNELGPATKSVSSGRVTVTASQKVTVANMPNTSAITIPSVKLISRTGDSLASANFCTNTSTAITSCTRSGSTLTVISPTHGLSSNDIVVLSGTTNFDSVYSITVSDVNTFTVTLFLAVGQNTTGANTTGGTCKRIVSAAAATTSVDVLAPTQDTSILVNDTNRGLAASAFTGSNAGYQFYASIYNPNGGGHVGNRTAVGAGRFLFIATTTAAIGRVNARITSLPDLSGTDSEWSILIGRTNDGATIPYQCSDSNGNFFFTASGQTAITLTTQGTLGQSLVGAGVELPSRNGIIPAACDKFAVVSDYIYAADSISATIRRSASNISTKSNGYAGRPEQSWAPDDIETFPTNQVPTAIAEVDLELFAATISHCAILTDLTGILSWRGPWRKGCCGKRAWVRTDHGFFWVSGDKELCTFQNGLPLAISEEYEAAELALIDSTNIGSVECAYYRNASQQKDEIRIEFIKSDATRHTTIHDFRNADGRSPNGQGYGAEFVGPLANQFTVFTADAEIIDSTGTRQIYAGASNGQIYQCYSGSNDGGTEFTSDAIGLLNAGEGRTDVARIDIYGDSNITVSIGQNLKTSTSATAEFGFAQVKGEAVPTYDNMYRFKYDLGIPEVTKAYLRLQLTSHSADGTLALNTIPHCPLETYGRLYEIIPIIGSTRPT